jgi:GNAT superfamily N-acetyltransferase
MGDERRLGLHVRILAVAMPVRGQGFGREWMKLAEHCAVGRGCTDASSTPSVFKRDLFYEKLGYRVFGTL